MAVRTTPRGLVWFFGISTVLLDGAALYFLGDKATGLLMLTMPTMLGLCGVDVFVNREQVAGDMKAALAQVEALQKALTALAAAPPKQ